MLHSQVVTPVDIAHLKVDHFVIPVNIADLKVDQVVIADDIVDVMNVDQVPRMDERCVQLGP